jgi:hypothetical protein
LADVELNPAGDDVQLYVLPLTAVAPIMVDAPVQIDLSVPATADGNGLTVIVTDAVVLQPFAVTV